MDFPYNYNSTRLLLISLVSAVFIIYPNIAGLSRELSQIDSAEHAAHLSFFAFRFLFFGVLIFIILKYNLEKIKTILFRKRLVRSFLLAVVAYLVYVCISRLSSIKVDCFTSMLLFQFFVVGIVCAFVGHMFQLYGVQLKKEQEIEQLKIENLQSRCNALTNQINPHFFFNSLNGLSALIRKKNEENTLAYVNKLSDVFRYILQSEKKGLVTLGEELEFAEAFRYMMEVRFANKLVFNIVVARDKMGLKLPVLSLLPLIDNIVMHNVIDSQHKMVADIWLNEQRELVISNPVFPKHTPAATSGTGLQNLENRFFLLMNRSVRIEPGEKIFRVYLPLK
ncbi:MAG: histidine kinase [Tannerella sp.]|jgi:sensor histidine kinase YesM|nr:histidine kinase [Tannerella sp.]